MRTLRQRLSGMSILGISVFLTLIPGSAFAQALSPAQSFVSTATSLTMFVFTILHFLSWFALSILDHIMDPNFIFALNQDGSDGSLLNMLREIWQFTRDIVNLGFAMALIAGAIMMIITADGSKIKDHLFKFVLALVLVNFSWFIPRVIFDASQVVTFTIYQIPSLIGGDQCSLPASGKDPNRRDCVVVLNYKFLENTKDIGKVPGADGLLVGNDGTTGWDCTLRPLVCVQTVKMKDAPAQVRTSTKVLDGLVVNHSRLQSLAQIQNVDAEAKLGPGVKASDSVQTLLTIVIKLVMVLVMQVAIVFPLIAMVAAFFIRIPVLWVTIAFMPVVALGYVFETVKPFTEKVQQAFVEAILLPIKVAIPFAIGFIMVNAGSVLEPPPGLGNFPLLPIFSGIRDMWQLIWMGIALYVVWHYSFEALKGGDTPIGAFTEQIKGFGSSIGSIAAQAPLSVPIPVPGKEGASVSLGQLGKAFNPNSIAQNLKSFSTFDAVGDGIRGRLGLKKPDPIDPKVVIQKKEYITVSNDIRDKIKVAASLPDGDPTRDAKLLEIQKELKKIPQLNEKTYKEIFDAFSDIYTQDLGGVAERAKIQALIKNIKEDKQKP